MRKLLGLFTVLSFFTVLPAMAQTNTARMLSGVNAQTGTTYTFVCTDATKLVTFNNGSAVAATLFAPNDPCSGPGIMFSVKNIGAGTVTITPVSGTIDGNASLILQSNQGADLWNDGANYFSQGSTSAGPPPPPGFPRLDQIPDPNVDKAFNLGITNLSFFNGNVNFLGTSLAIPNSAGCTATATGQICLDTTLLNVHLWNGADTNVALFPAASTFTSGDVLGVSVVAGQKTLQDLAPVNALDGNTFWLVSNTSPIDGDVPCWDTTGPPFVNNCTAGAIDTSINGATTTYTIALADQLTTIDHDVAASQSVTVTLPTADTLGINPGFVFIYSNHSTHADTITPTTWTINGGATLAVAANVFCRIRVDPNSTTKWIADCANMGSGTVTNVTASAPIVSTGGATPNISCPTCGVGSGNLSGALTSGKVPVASGAITLVDGSILDDRAHAARNDFGFDVNSSGAYNFWVPNNAVTGTTANKMSCDDGAAKAIICNHTTTTTNAPIGVAVILNGAAPGLVGSTGECIIGFCSVVFDNGATANHFAQMSTTIDGDLSDVGTTPPANGLSYWYVFSGNGGAGTQAIIRNILPSELNASSISGGKSIQVQVNGSATTKAIKNFNSTTPAAGANNQNLVVQTSASGNTDSISLEVPLATTGQAGIVQLAGALGGTSASPTLASPYNKLRCETGLGDGLNAITAGTYLQFFCVNTSGSTWTITGINCWTDNAGTSTLNAANNAGTGLLTGAVTCNSTKSGGGAAGTQSGTTTLPNNDAISFTFIADGTSKQTTWVVSFTQ